MFSDFKLLVSFLVASILCLFSFNHIGIEALPKLESDDIYITYNLDNSPPKIIEERVTSVIENAASSLSGIKSIKSISRENFGQIQISFESGVDIDFKKLELRQIIKQIFSKLPLELSFPSIKTATEFQLKNPFLIIGVTSSNYDSLIHDYLNILVPSLTMEKGIDEVVFNASKEKYLSINVKKSAFEAYSINQSEIVKELSSFNKPFFTSFSNEREKITKIAYHDSLLNLNHIKSIILKNSVRLNDIADIEIKSREPDSYYRINGEETKKIQLVAKDGANTYEIKKRILEKIGKLKMRLAANTEIIVIEDNTQVIIDEIKKVVLRTLLTLLLLILFILLIKQNFNYLFTVIISILLNGLFTTFLMWLFNISINLYSISGIAIAIGIITDNSILVIDHLHKRKTMNVVGLVIITTTSTMLAIWLIHSIAKGNKESMYLNHFAMVIGVSLIVSVFISIFFIPAFWRQLTREKKTTKEKSFSLKRKINWLISIYVGLIRVLYKIRTLIIISIIITFGIPIFLLPMKISGSEFYNSTLGSEFYQNSIRPYTDKYLGGTFRVFYRKVLSEAEYLNPEKPKLVVEIELPGGHTLNQLNEIVRKLEKYLATKKGVSRIISNIYSAENATVEIFFKHPSSNLIHYKIRGDVISFSYYFSGSNWNIYGVGTGFSKSEKELISSYRILLKGYEYEKLNHFSSVFHKLIQQNKRINNINLNLNVDKFSLNRQSFSLNIDRRIFSKARGSGLEMITEITSQSTKNYPSIKVGNSTYPVSITESEEDLTIQDLLNRPIKLEETKIRLNEFTNISTKTFANPIYREDRQYITVIGFDYYGDTRFGNKFVNESLNNLERQLPTGYSYEKESMLNEWAQKKEKYPMMLVVLCLGIFVISSVYFESLTQPLIVFAIIPISFIGSFITFSHFNIYFDQGGYVGLLLLGGLVVNSVYIIVNDLNLNSKLSGSIYERVCKSVIRKSFPIIATIISTCLGLTPFLIISGTKVFWFAFASSIISGLLFSIIGIFVVLPILLISNSSC